MTLADLEKQMRVDGTVAVNIQCDGAGFRVHVRRSLNQGFDCAQRRHDTISAALDEHFGTNTDLGDLLV
jgi:hypothetical protein